MERICYDGAESAFCQKLKASFPFSFLKNRISDAHSITHIVERDISPQFMLGPQMVGGLQPKIRLAENLVTKLRKHSLKQPFGCQIVKSLPTCYNKSLGSVRARSQHFHDRVEVIGMTFSQKLSFNLILTFEAFQPTNHNLFTVSCSDILASSYYTTSQHSIYRLYFVINR